MLLSGCASTLEVRPRLPASTFTQAGGSRLGVFMSPGNVADSFPLKPGSGIWPATEYDFSPGRTVQEDLVRLTQRHFEESGFAEDPVDKRWNLVVEFLCYPPEVESGTLKTDAPLRLTLRDPRTLRAVQSEILTGTSPRQSGRILRLLGGQWFEKKGLEEALTEAYSDLYRKVDGQLARAAASESELRKTRPYRREDLQSRSQQAPTRRRSR